MGLSGEIFKLFGTIGINNTDANKAIGETTQKGEEAQGKLSKVFAGLGNAALSVGKVALKAGEKIAEGLAVGTVAFAGLTKKSLSLAGELEQNIGGSEAVFKEYANKMQKDAEKAFAKMGLSTSAYLATANKMGSLFKGAGFDVKEAADLTVESMQRAADVASIMGLSTESAMEAIAGAAKGNFTMMDNLGVAMNETTLSAYALAKGIDKSTDKMTNQEKISLAMQMFLEKTADYAGNYAKENETLAGSLSTAKAALDNFLSGSGNVEDVIASWINAADVIIKNVDVIVPRLVQGIEDIIKKVVPMLPDLAKKLLPGIISAAVNLLKAFVENFSAIVDVLLEIAPDIISGIVDIAKEIIDELPTICKNIFDAIPKLIPQLLDAVMDLIESLLDHTPEMIDTISNGVMDIINSIVESLPQLVERLVEKLPGALLDIIHSINDNLPLIITGIVKLITAIIKELPSIIVMVIKNTPEIVWAIIEGLIYAIPALIEGIWDIIVSIFSAIIDLLAELGEWLWDGLGDAFYTGWETIKSFVLDIVTWLYDNLIAPVVNFFVGLWEDISGLFKEAAKWFYDNVVEPLVSFFREAWESISEFFVELWEDISGAFKEAAKWFYDNVIEPIVTFFRDMWNSISGFFTDAWNSISGFFASIPRWIYENVIQPIADFFTGLWNGIKNGIESVVNGIISGIETFLNWIIDALNWFISGISSVTSYIGDIVGADWSLGEISHVSLGRVELANGGVVDKPTNTLIGEAGAEAVVPLDQNRKWISAVAADMQSTFGSEGTEEIRELKLIIKSFVDELPEIMAEAFSNMRFDVNNREFARMVRAVQ